MSYLTSDGRSFVVRQPTQNDAEELINYSKILFASTDQLLTTPEEYDITVENEKVWINNLVQNPNAHILIAEMNNRIVRFLFLLQTQRKKIRIRENLLKKYI